MCNVTTACSRRVCARYVSEGSHMVPDGHISATYVHGTLYICPRPQWTAKRVRRRAIYFHVNNARVNRQGPGREHAHSTTLKQHLTLEWTRAATSWRTANEISRRIASRRNESWKEHPRSEEVKGRERDRKIGFSKCDLRSLISSYRSRITSRRSKRAITRMMLHRKNTDLIDKTRVIRTSYEIASRIFFGNS